MNYLSGKRRIAQSTTSILTHGCLGKETNDRKNKPAQKIRNGNELTPPLEDVSKGRRYIVTFGVVQREADHPIASSTNNPNNEAVLNPGRHILPRFRV